MAVKSIRGNGIYLETLVRSILDPAKCWSSSPQVNRFSAGMAVASQRDASAEGADTRDTWLSRLGKLVAADF